MKGAKNSRDFPLRTKVNVTMLLQLYREQDHVDIVSTFPAQGSVLSSKDMQVVQSWPRHPFFPLL
jgi:hypothetical protein